MRFPNGYGSVYKLSGNRRNPWVVALTETWEKNTDTGKSKQKRTILGYYPTQTKANIALAQYNDDPYDLKAKNLSFQEVYDKWSGEYYANVVDGTKRTCVAAYKYCTDIYDMKMIDLRVAHLESVIDKADVGNTTKARIKSLFNMMYKYAMKHEIVKKDYSPLVNSVKVSVERKKEPFTGSEIDILWNNLDKQWANVTLILIYTGWRISELLGMLTSNIDIDNKTMLGGIKTDAGKDRIVPIHSKIFPLVEKYYNNKTEYLITREDGKPIPYRTYLTYHHDLMDLLGMVHIIHETRHTTATLLDNAGANKVSIKRILGHESSDVTEKVYTHKDIEELRKAIELI